MLISQNRKQLVLNSALELGEDLTVEKKGKGRKFVSRFIEAGLAHYQEFGDILITKETLDKFIHTMVGCPLIINHKEITDKNADKERVGVISNVWFNDMDGWYYCDGIIWDTQAIDLVKNQGWSVSCTYDFVSDNLEKTHNGKKISMEFIDGEFLHLALVNNPRYERANIVINSKDQAENWDESKHPRDEKGQFAKVLEEVSKKNQTKTYEDKKEANTNTKKELGTERITFEYRQAKDFGDYIYEVNSVFFEKLDKIKEKNLKEASYEAEDKLEYIEEKYKELAKYMEDGRKRQTEEVIKKLKGYVNNGWITTDRINEDGERIKIWIPENVHWVPPKEKARVLEICENYKQGDETKYDFSHTRVKPTEEQIKYLKDTVKDIENNYGFKGIAQIEISSSLNSGSFGVCFSPDNTSLISLAPMLYKEGGQKKWDYSVDTGFHPKGTGDAIRSTLVHEIAHAITCNSKDKEFWNKIAKIKMDYMKNITKEDIKNKDFISNYARTNQYEFVAEAFCQGTLSKKYGKYTSQVMETIKEHFGKNVQRKLALNEKDKETNINDIWIEEYGYGYPIDEEEYEKFKKEVDKQEDKELKETKNNKAQNGKDTILMTVLKDLEKFIKGIVDNACDKEEKVENEDKRKIIDEVGGILKDKVDEEVWRTIVGKIEKIAYNPSETDKADNKCKNEDDKEEEKEEKFEEEKEIAENKKAKNEDKEDKEEDKKEDKADNKCAKNSMEDIAGAIMGGNVKTKTVSSYVSQSDRLKAGEQY